MRSRFRIALVVTAAVIGSGAPAAALAAAPPNDSPAAATDLMPYTAENGPPVERQGAADLREATADAGVPRCLGATSFQRTVWFRLAPTDTPQRVRIAVPTAEGEPAELADLAAFVQPATGVNIGEPQACDGPAARPASALVDGSPAVVLHVPAGRAVLVQAGWSAAATANGLIVTAEATVLPVSPAPAGDTAGAAPALVPGRLGAVPLAGALLSHEDPAQPACPAAATVWRKVRIARSGRQNAAASGGALTTLTAFVGPRPTADNVTGCARRGTSAVLRTSFRARRGQTAWLRIGSDALAPAGARVTLSGPCDRRPLDAAARTSGRVLGIRRARPAVRVRVTDGCLRGVRIEVRRRGIVVARASRSTLAAGTTTIAVRGSLPGGRLHIRVIGRDVLRKDRPTVRLVRSVTVG